MIGHGDIRQPINNDKLLAVYRRPQEQRDALMFSPYTSNGGREPQPHYGQVVCGPKARLRTRIRVAYLRIRPLGRKHFVKRPGKYFRSTLDRALGNTCTTEVKSVRNAAGTGEKID